ncbi:uncharacterized protein LOC132065368 [Lycium ferocissimum]|uniref:uncharacterized protein LOC132065368 n=1 Tax=Lycium ferocissimum TaxID=112874 RepID=UPI0028155578|nr:uncharacterized protein LOC132065368 [Lycium ferocissimum]XP_059314721.1 uncharacterized protein LOC132065368 [Lycium ferocissimum]XP_059314722.1 uncharacterized protein LOC132065368 [Lycium ferocissimum]XP_059314723.1 uncharacterized protein LOC132065368 [Lycium ferocissimum]
MITATPSYWLTWRFLILGSGFLVVVGISALIIWKYEGSPNSGKNQERDNNKEKKKVGFLYKDEAWTTCHKAIHPAVLLAYRIIAFIFLLSMLSMDAVTNSTDIFFFYTQWTFSLVTIYFALGSSLSIYGCIQYRKGVADAKVCCIDEERNDSPTLEKNASLPGVSKDLSSNEETDVREAAGYLGYAFQIIFQVCAGAVVLTDCIYWLLIYPLFTPSVYKLRFLVVGMHSINAATLLGDVILNSLRFPFFRFAYFVLYTCTFVAFQWLVHMCVSKWWPYPFLDLSFKYAPYFYLMVGVIHLPCYGLFALVIAMKYWLARLFKWMIRKLSG